MISRPTNLVTPSVGQQTWSHHQQANKLGHTISRPTNLVTSSVGQQTWSHDQQANKLGHIISRPTNLVTPSVGQQTWSHHQQANKLGHIISRPTNLVTPSVGQQTWSHHQQANKLGHTIVGQQTKLDIVPSRFWPCYLSKWPPHSTRIAYNLATQGPRIIILVSIYVQVISIEQPCYSSPLATIPTSTHLGSWTENFVLPCMPIFGCWYISIYVYFCRTLIYQKVHGRFYGLDWKR